MLAALAHSFAPVVEDRFGFVCGFGLSAKSGEEGHAPCSRETKYDFGKVFIDFGSGCTARKFASIEGSNGLQIELSLADEDCAGDDPLHRSQEGECSFVEVKLCDITGQSEIIEAEG